MADIREPVSRELEALLDQGSRLLTELGNREEGNFRDAYQTWYTRAFVAVQHLLPERLVEFISLYNEKGSRHTIAKYLRRTTASDSYRTAVYMRFLQQYQILESAQTRLDTILTNIHSLIQAKILDRELESATELWRAGHIRSAGILAGVVLEKHLVKVCSSRNLAPRKKKPALTDWNDVLKNAGVYDMPVWLVTQHLVDIHNLCAHSGSREPTREEVDDLIRGVEHVTRTIF